MKDANAIMKKFEKREQIELENNGQKIFGIMHRPLKNAPYPKSSCATV